MADKTTTKSELKFEWLFVDGDTRTFTEENPKDTITASEIRELETLILNEGTPLLIGDKSSAAFRRINSVVREDTTTTILDVSLN